MDPHPFVVFQDEEKAIKKQEPDPPTDPYRLAKLMSNTSPDSQCLFNWRLCVCVCRMMSSASTGESSSLRKISWSPPPSLVEKRGKRIKNKEQG
jgi:hypothetical protein